MTPPQEPLPAIPMLCLYSLGIALLGLTTEYLPSSYYSQSSWRADTMLFIFTWQVPGAMEAQNKHALNE